MKSSLKAFILCVFFSAAGNTAGYLTPFSGEGVAITKYFTNSSGGVTLFVTGAINNPDNCQVIDRVHLRSGSTGHEQHVSAVLAAFAAGKKVGLWSKGCESIPFFGVQAPVITNLWVIN